MSRKEAVQVNVAILVVGFAAVIILQIASLVGHSIISGRERAHDEASERFRRQISCFVVGTAQGKTGTDLLTTCGFIQIGGGP